MIFRLSILTMYFFDQINRNSHLKMLNNSISILYLWELSDTSWKRSSNDFLVLNVVSHQFNWEKFIDFYHVLRLNDIKNIVKRHRVVIKDVIKTRILIINSSKCIKVIEIIHVFIFLYLMRRIDKSFMFEIRVIDFSKLFFN